jgi:ribonuclease Z
VHYPSAGERYFQRLRAASAGQERIPVDGRPASGRETVYADDAFTLRCAPLEHRVATLGWRVEEPDRRHMLPDRLAALGIVGADVGRLQRAGHLRVGSREVRIEDVSEPRRGQVVALVMDTRWCEAALELAEGADLLICEATFLSAEEQMAEEYGHMTARQAGRLARMAGARKLVLTHFSRRYTDLEPFEIEARAEFDDVVLAQDLDRIPVPPRQSR